MATFNIYSNNNGEDSDPSVVVTLNDENTEIVEIVGDTPENQAEAEEVLKSYMDHGFTAIDALFQYAGSYGTVESADGSEVPVAAAAEVDEGPAEVTLGDGIMAMTEDNGTVVTLLRKDPEQGAVYRHDGEWLPVVDPTVFDGLAFVGVEDSAEATYDKYEDQDLLVPIDHYYPSAEGPYWPHMVVETDDTPTTDLDGEDIEPEDGDTEVEEEDAEPVAASVTLDSADDLTAAIEAAVEDPELQWYVERRVAALGLEASLPWQQT